jgi:hypothetical protein
MQKNCDLLVRNIDFLTKDRSDNYSFYLISKHFQNYGIFDSLMAYVRDHCTSTNRSFNKMYLITTIENLRILDGPPSTNTITPDCLYGALVKVTIGYRNTFYFLNLVLFTHVRHKGIKDSIVLKVL